MPPKWHWTMAVWPNDYLAAWQGQGDKYKRAAEGRFVAFWLILPRIASS